MFCHRPWFRLACVVLLLLTAGLVFPAAAQARPAEEEPPSRRAEPARLADVFRTWIAEGEKLVHLFGKEGWGMDPNGGKATARPIASETTQAAGDLP